VAEGLEGGQGIEGVEAPELPCCLRDLVGLPAAEERELLGEIFSERWDQGCLICDSADLRAPGLDPHTIAALLREVGDRDAVHPATGAAQGVGDDPLPQLVPDEDSGLLVLSQRCDIVKPLRIEPLVEVALAHRSTDVELLAIVRRDGSACHLHLTDDQGDEAEGGWVVDLRTRGHLPKHWLKGRRPAHLVPPGRPRRRFAGRLGERSSRIPVPTAIVDGFQHKLRDWLYASARRRAQCSFFSEFLLLPSEDGAWALIAILGDGKDADEATVAFDALLGAIVDRVEPFPLGSDYSGVLRPEELSHADYLAAFKLDFKRVTYGSKSASTAQAEPMLGQS
jgi:hypothetical protein